jgi:hypothetical protein
MLSQSFQPLAPQSTKLEEAMEPKHLKPLYLKTIGWLEANNAKPDQIDAYNELWRIAEDKVGEPIPCPRCLLQGDSRSRLQPLVGAHKCYACKETFEYPDE